MTTTMLIARLLLPVFALVTIAAFVNPKRFKNISKEIANNSALAYIASFINLIGGTAIIMYHNTWVQDRSTLITVIGWLAAIKGAVYMLFPRSLESVAEWAGNKTTVYICAVIGALMTIALFSISGLR